MRAARLLRLGRQPYRSTLALQRNLHARVAKGEAPETWIFVEHDPVVTLGRNAKPGGLRVDESTLGNLGVDVVRIERGGEATYHGPGQLVVYPIMRLERFREIVPLVRKLEGIVIAACAAFDVATERWSEHAGIWVGDRQICAVGLAVRNMTTLHGIALNVNTELDYDRLIVPCGLPDRGITSLRREVGREIPIASAAAALRAAVEAAFDVVFVEDDESGSASSAAS